MYSSNHEVLHLGPPPNGSREKLLAFTVADIEVIALPDTNVYPTLATGAIALNQQQILDDGAAKVEVLLDRLNLRVENSANETVALKQFLVETATAAQQELQKSRERYVATLTDKSQEPVVFEDFARRYDAYIVDTRVASNRSAPWSGTAHVELAQYSKQTITVHPPQLGGTLGPLVSQLAEIMGDHRAAFQRMAATGVKGFTISLKSSPPGAKIRYKRAGETYQEYSSPTDVDQATFPYARWTFEFSLAGCVVIKKPNAYIEQSPNLNVPMKDCVKP